VGDWILLDRCRLVCVLGLGGIGKTSLAGKLAQDLAPAFERVYWRGVRNAPPLGEWLAGAIGFLSRQQRVPPAGDAERCEVLLELLRAQPSLLVLDNFETVLEPVEREGRYRNGLDGYGELLRVVGEVQLPNCASRLPASV
jgi:predicted ATPase